MQIRTPFLSIIGAAIGVLIANAASAQGMGNRMMEGGMGPGMMQGGSSGMMGKSQDASPGSSGTQGPMCPPGSCPCMEGGMMCSDTMRGGMGSGMMGRDTGSRMRGSGMMHQRMYSGMPDSDGGSKLFGSYVVPTMNLSVDDVRNYLSSRIERLNNKRLKVGDVKAEDTTITADVVTVDNSLVQRLKIDRRTGEITYEN